MKAVKNQMRASTDVVLNEVLPRILLDDSMNMGGAHTETYYKGVRMMKRGLEKAHTVADWGGYTQGQRLSREQVRRGVQRGVGPAQLERHPRVEGHEEEVRGLRVRLQ